MKYQVSEKIQQRFDALVARDDVQKAFHFIEEDQYNIIETQCELTLIPAPTFHEEKKAARLLEIFKEEGLSDCHIDDYGNVVGIRKGTAGGTDPSKNVLIEGHIDTVFPADTKLEITRDDEYIYCPGISDDTRGVASVLAVLRAMNAANIVTTGDIHFVGTVQEEGTGALKGMQYYCQHHKDELGASISIDGTGYSTVLLEATGIQTYEVVFHGIGGHACMAFGDIANPIHAAGRAIAKIAEFQVPEYPMTTFAVTNLQAGSFEAVHSIVSEALIRFNFRSNDQAILEELRERIFKAIDEACQEETDRWGKDTITYTIKHICDVNAGQQDPHIELVQACMAAAHYVGAEEPQLGKGGSTNCSRAIEAGIPAVCMGNGEEYDTRCHSLEERFRPEGAYKCPQVVLLAALLSAE